MGRQELTDTLRDPGHVAVRRSLRVAGPCLLVSGVGLLVVGIGSFFASFGSPEFGPPRYFWCAFLGMPVVWLGAVMTGAGYLGAAQRYAAGESVPVQKDAFNSLAAGTRGGVRTIAEALGEGLSAGASGGTACPKCRGLLPNGARFCPGCGASFAVEACPACGSQLVPGARFCHACGGARRDSEIA